ncbi:unnamed protein product [Adineta steineri]|uniref:Uncharacterized protein n=1 Tax=Adineta steineri TaxID=433720 RepID=A0A814TTG4_9BILA|nr:unnamed protein product [Adineta steineri]CAF1191260.1 unnamed protein product [Adineta steineri]CAF4004268.1 unnamed protein product [Adineta steineri]
MHINVSPTPHPPRIRRVSQHELQSFFPNIRSNRVSSNSTTSIRLSQGSKASRSSLLNRQSLQRGNNSQLSRQNFEPANNRQSNQQNESESEDIKSRSTSSSTSSTSSTISTSSTSSTSTSTSSSTTATTSTTSTTSTSTSTTTSSSTSTTSVTTSTTTTTPNPTIASIDQSNITGTTWKLFTCSYFADISANLTLQFTCTVGHKGDWYLDDISVKDPTSVEMLTNGNLEASPALTGWSTGSGGAISTAEYHSSGHSFDVSDTTAWISQSFATIGGQVYTVTFWLYLNPSPGSSGGDPTVIVTMN